MAGPNEGFMAQLNLYKDMGCPRDLDLQPRYQRWLYQKEVDLALAAGMAPDKVRFEDEEVQEKRKGEGREVELRCRKCRYVALIPLIVSTEHGFPFAYLTHLLHVWPSSMELEDCYYDIAFEI